MRINCEVVSRKDANRGSDTSVGGDGGESEDATKTGHEFVEVSEQHPFVMSTGC